MKRSLFIIFGLMLSFWLVACSSDSVDEAGNDNNNGGETSEEANEGTSEEEVTIRIAWWGEQERTNYTLEVIELFEEQNPGVTIEAEYASWEDYWRKLAPQAAANELPDIIQMDQSYIEQYSGNNQIADLTPFIGEQVNVDHIAENTISGGEVNGGLYGFNIGSTALSTYYNPAIAEEIGLDDFSGEWTWEDYEEVAEKAAEAGYLAGDSVGTVYVPFTHYLRTHDAKLYAEDGNELGYDDDQLFIDYFTMQKKLVDIGAAQTPDAIAQQTGLEDSPIVTGEALGGGIGWVTQFMGTQQVAEHELEIKTPPQSESGNNGLYIKPGMYFSMAENSEHKEIAAKFIDFFVNDIEANKLILGDRGIPVSSEVKEALMDHIPESQAKVFEYMNWVEQNSSPMGPVDPAKAGEVNDALIGIAEEIVYDQISVEEAAVKFRSEAESIFGQ